MAQPFPPFNYDPGIDPTLTFPSPGLAAQVVVTAINIIRNMATSLEVYAEGQQGPAIDLVIDGIPALPDETQVRWASTYSNAVGAMALARQPVAGAILPMPDYAVDNAVGTLADRMLDAIETLFPEVAAAGEMADAALIAGLNGGTGVTHTESVDRLNADNAFAFDQREAYAQERLMVDAAAAAGHRFLPGAAFDAIARLHAATVRQHDQAVAAAYQARVAEEQAAKLKLARAATDARMRNIREFTSKVVDLFRLKQRAHALHVADHNALIGEKSDLERLTAAERNRIEAVIQETARKRHDARVKAAQIGDNAVTSAKLKVATSGQMVDMLGTLSAQLYNQIRASGGWSGSEQDVTDYSA